MNKVSIIKAIVKLYFLGALTGSFIHLVEAAHKLGLGNEAIAIPFMIDGIAVIGMVMRSEAFSKRTRKIGFRTQAFAAMMSLAGNVYAASSLGGIIFGVGIVALFIFAEWLSDNIECAEEDVKREAERIVREAEEATQAKKRVAIEKGKITKARNARVKKAEVKVLETMLSK